MARKPFKKSKVTAWRKDVWLTVSACDRDLPNLAIDLAEMYELRKKLAIINHTNPKELPQVMQDSLNEMEQSQGCYVLAFRMIHDVIVLLKYQGKSWYKTYSNPQNIEQFSIDMLYQRFPLEGNSPLEIKIFLGEEICRDPRFRPDPGPGSLATEVPSLIPHRDWWRYSIHNFFEGIYLVKVYSPIQCCAISPNDVKDPWYTAIRQKLGRNERDISGYEMEVEAEARQLLSRTMKEKSFLVESI